MPELPQQSENVELMSDLMAERGPIFDEVPSGLQIMHWFIDKTLAREWVWVTVP